MPHGAVKAALEAGTIAAISTAADFQLPAYAIYRPLHTSSDPALECLESSILEVAASLEEVQRSSLPSGSRQAVARHKRRADLTGSRASSRTGRSAP